MKNLLSLLLLFSACYAHAQTWNHEWGRNLGLPNGPAVTAITTTPAGHIFTAVTTGDETMNSDQAGDILLYKHDAAGNLIWQKTFGGLARAHTLKFDSDHNLIMGGGFRTHLALGTDTLFQTSSSTSFSCLFLVKLDSAGQVLWGKSECAESQRKLVFSITLDAQNNIYAVGQHLSLEALFAKYAPNGDLIWRKPMPGIRAVSDVVVDQNNNIYISASCPPNVGFDTVAAPLLTGTSYKLALVKYNQEPTALWARTHWYHTFDLVNALLYHNNSIYWLYDRQIAQNTRRKFISRYSTQGALLADTMQIMQHFAVKVNRFSALQNGSVVWAQAINDSTNLVVLDSTLSNQQLVTLKAQANQMEMSGISSYGNNLVVSGRFKGAELAFGSHQIPNANYASGAHLFDNYLGLLSLSLPVSVQEETGSLPAVRLYPNPAGNVAYATGPLPEKIVLFDCTGRQVFAATGTNQVNLSQLPTGIYLAHLYIAGQVVMQKLVKQ